jgi:rhomboid protease GluP
MNQFDDNRQQPAPQNSPSGESPSTAPAPQRVSIAMPETGPYVTYTIIGITILAYLIQISPYGNLFVRAFIKSNELIREGQLWRLITPALLHGGFTHIVFNMYALLSFGQSIERHFGHGRFLLLYLLGAFAGNVMSFLMTNANSLGASTAIFALVGAEAVFLLKNRKLFAGQFRSAISNIIFIVFINLFIIGALPNIDNWGHIGGLVGGLMFSWFASPVWEVEGIAPQLQLVDQRPTREVITGAALVVLVFGGLAMWGMIK